MKQSVKSLETLMSALGGKGKFQIMIHLLVANTYIVLVFNHVIMAFHGTPVPHTCMVGGNVYEAEVMNSTESSYTLYNSKLVVNVTHSSCSSELFYSNGENERVECSAGQWKYKPKFEEKNIVSQFDLVCSNKHYANLATTIYFAGVMVGGLVFGDLADRFGRLPILFFTLYSSIAVGIIIAFSVSYEMFVSLRFIDGILMQGLQTSAYTLIMELFLPKHRPFAGAVTECFFGGSIMVLAGLAYFLRDWQHLQIAISLTGVLTIFYPWVVPESLRWLIAKGKIEKAEALIRRICKVNKIPYPDECWEMLKKDTEVEKKSPGYHKKYNLTDMFRTPHIRKRSIILFYLWLAISASYYGLTFKMTITKGNRYLNFFIGGAVETLAYAASLPIMRKFGRKKPLFACFIFAAAMCLSAGIISYFAEDQTILITALALAGRCSVACLFGIIFVYTSEIYPTVIRNIGMGACCFWARFGGVIAPQINQLAQSVPGFDANIIFGAMALLAGLLVFPLPETHNTKLPDSLGEVEDSDISDQGGTSSSGTAQDGDEEEMELRSGKLPLKNRVDV